MKKQWILGVVMSAVTMSAGIGVAHADYHAVYKMQVTADEFRAYPPSGQAWGTSCDVAYITFAPNGTPMDDIEAIARSMVDQKTIQMNEGSGDCTTTSGRLEILSVQIQ